MYMEGLKVYMKKNNKGITLIEIIVSLLVLMIIMVPLLSGFVTSIQANRTAKANAYAKNVAEGVMEGVKKLGIKKTAEQFYLTDNSKFLLSSNCTSFDEVVPAGSHPSMVNVDGEFKFSAQDAGEYTFRMFGIKEGISKYDAKVVISNVAYKSAAGGTGDLPNDFQYADLSAFASSSSAIINPILKDSNYDTRAIEYFKEKNKEYKNGIWNDANEDVLREYNEKVEEYRRKYEDWENAGKQGPEPVEPTAPPTTELPTYLTEAEIKPMVKKKMNIQIDKYQNSEGEDRYKLNATVDYTATNDGAANPSVPNYDDTRPFQPGVDPVTYTAQGFCSNKVFTDLRSIVIMYSCFNDDRDLDKENIKIIDNTGDKMEVYLVAQTNDVSEFNNSKIKLDVTKSNASDMTVFTNIGINKTGANVTVENDMIKDGTTKDALYNVQVNIYEGDGSFSKSIAELKSSFVNE